MKKSIVTIVAFMLFTLAGFAQGGERVYIRDYSSASKATLYIWQNGVTKEHALNANGLSKNIKENLTEFAVLLESYLTQGFKIVSVTTKPVLDGYAQILITEYILEKQ